MFKESDILDIVREHSGGIKFTELLSILAVKMKENQITFDVDGIEKTIRKSHRMKILEYTWQNRVKMFVYTP